MTAADAAPRFDRPSETPRKKKKHPLRALLINLGLVALAFGLLGWTIYQNRERLEDVFSHRINGRTFALGFGLGFGIYMTGLLLTFVRWFWLVRVVEPRFRLRDSFLLGFIGNVFNLLVPGAVGGDFFKAAFLARMRIKKTQAIASMVIDRIVGLLGLFLLAGVAGLAAWSRAPIDVRRLIIIVWCALAAGLAGLWAIFAQSLTRRYPSLLEGHGRMALILRELRELSIAYRQRLGLVASTLLLSSFTHGMSVLAFYTISRTLFEKGVPSLADHYLMVPLTLFTTAVPLPFGALGLSEQVGQKLFQLVNYPEGALGMMAFRLLMYGGGLVGASVYLLNLRQVRELTETAEHIQEEVLEGELAPDGDEPPAPVAGGA